MNDRPSLHETSHYEEASLVEDIPHQPSESRGNNNAVRFYSPLVLNIAASEGISMSELEQIEGTGQDGRVSKKDIMLYLENRKNQSHQKHTEATAATTIHEVPSPPQRQEYSSTCRVYR